MIQESVKAATRAERERVQNEANRAEGPNVAPVARECTFAQFMKCSPITFRGNEGAVVFAAATFQDRALTWWNSQVATVGIKVVTRKTCGMQHYGNCPIKCNKCGKIGYKARDCWSKVVATDANAQPVVTCYGCGEKGHIKTNCPARNN
nr:reverse transcriptase domain-containing protein [Tanacetum cinerariifolium]